MNIIFLYIIPIVSGVLSAHCGLSAFDEPLKYFVINVPVCVLSCCFYWFYKALTG